jgi:hypothetical protein
MQLRTLAVSLCLTLLTTVTLLPRSATHASPVVARRLHVAAVVEPRVNVRSLSDERLAALRAAVVAEPRRRTATRL